MRLSRWTRWKGGSDDGGGSNRHVLLFTSSLPLGHTFVTTSTALHQRARYRYSKYWLSSRKNIPRTSDIVHRLQQNLHRLRKEELARWRHSASMCALSSIRKLD